MSSNLRDLIARYREQTSGLPDGDRVSITAGEARAFITAAEASLSAREALRQLADNKLSDANCASVEIASRRVAAIARLALKEPT